MKDWHPAYTPWDGSHPLFRIGLNRLDLDNWIEVDAKLAEYRAQKAQLLADNPGGVWFAEPETKAAQREVLALLSEHLVRRFPDEFEKTSDGDIVSLDQRFDVSAQADALKTAALLVQEDLVLMRRGDDSWRLVAGCVCFPSSWQLREKAGKPLGQIHGPVPQFHTGTRNAAMIQRIFDNLPVDQPVWRMNWSIYPDGQLNHGERRGEKVEGEIASKHLRVEYQTLRKLPHSGDILFTIRIHVDPLAMLAGHRDRARLAQGFVDSLRMLDADQIAYKGLKQTIGPLIEQIEMLGRS